jgi:hypothetical protein
MCGNQRTAVAFPSAWHAAKVPITTSALATIRRCTSTNTSWDLATKDDLAVLEAEEEALLAERFDLLHTM